MIANKNTNNRHNQILAAIEETRLEIRDAYKQAFLKTGLSNEEGDADAHHQPFVKLSLGQPPQDGENKAPQERHASSRALQNRTYNATVVDKKMLGIRTSIEPEPSPLAEEATDVSTKPSTVNFTVFPAPAASDNNAAVPANLVDSISKFLEKVPLSILKQFINPQYLTNLNKIVKTLQDNAGTLEIAKAAIVSGKETTLMFDRSLIGPIIDLIPDSIYPLFLGFNYPICLPQNDANLWWRHLIQEQRIVNYNYTRQIRFADYYGPPLDLGFPIFKRLPPSGDMSLTGVSNADNIFMQVGYTVNVAIRGLVGKLDQALSGIFGPTSFSTLQDYANAVSHFNPDLPILKNNQNDLSGFLNDVEFGRQRIQGIAPEMIRRVTTESWAALQEKLDLDANITKAMLDIIGVPTWEAAIAQGLYVNDYSSLDNQYIINLASSFNRFVCAPICLCYYDVVLKQMKPVGIQLWPKKEGRGRPQTQMFWPDDSLDWLMAKIWTNGMDGGYMELVSHLFECHIIAEIVITSSFRSLGETHPVLRLLKPHFVSTLQINTLALQGLLSQAGYVQLTIGGGSLAATTLIKQVYPNWSFYENSFKQSLINRGFLNADGVTVPDKIQGYWWRDDGLKLWAAIESFVTSVLEVYYKQPADFQQDWELQAWIKDIQAPNGGNLKGITKSGSVTNMEELSTLLTSIIFTMSVKHSVGNAGQLDYYGFIPNVPGAIYIEPVIKKGHTTWDTIMKSLPPKVPALNQMVIVYLLSDISTDLPMLGFGKYPTDWKIQQDAFKQTLTNISNEIEQREKGKVWPYTYMDPKQIGSSIYI